MRENRAFALLAILCLVPATRAQQPKAQPPKSVRLYVIDCGTLDIPDTSQYQFKKEELAMPMMSAPCFLVAHPKGTLMWDTGPVPDTNFKSGGGPATMRYATSTRPLSASLADIGYSPADMTYLALSHFHWDHVGNGNLFTGATWLVPKAERDIMFADLPSPRTEPANFSALKNSKTVLITKADFDVFGDGTVMIKAAPGHSPAHQVLFLKLKKTGPVVVSGDLYHYPEGTEAEQGSEHRIQCRSDSNVTRRGRGFSEENRRTALDSARLHCECQAKKIARFLRINNQDVGITHPGCTA
jgi:N-acyl homoserine lactone hydrolase